MQQTPHGVMVMMRFGMMRSYLTCARKLMTTYIRLKTEFKRDKNAFSSKAQCQRMHEPPPRSTALALNFLATFSRYPHTLT